ncbi:hypothetical protein [Enterovibrio norvegicus]|uniref:hypothetical protein n=1 Tax=Enterovibrio norvegicus TaxID=188144 RepID=UPI00352CBFB8
MVVERKDKEFNNGAIDFFEIIRTVWDGKHILLLCVLTVFCGMFLIQNSKTIRYETVTKVTPIKGEYSHEISNSLIPIFGEINSYLTDFDAEFDKDPANEIDDLLNPHSLIDIYLDNFDNRSIKGTAIAVENFDAHIRKTSIDPKVKVFDLVVRGNEISTINQAFKIYDNAARIKTEKYIYEEIDAIVSTMKANVKSSLLLWNVYKKTEAKKELAVVLSANKIAKENSIKEPIYENIGREDIGISYMGSEILTLRVKELRSQIEYYSNGTETKEVEKEILNKLDALKTFTSKNNDLVNISKDDIEVTKISGYGYKTLIFVSLFLGGVLGLIILAIRKYFIFRKSEVSF